MQSGVYSNSVHYSSFLSKESFTPHDEPEATVNSCQHSVVYFRYTEHTCSEPTCSDSGGKNSPLIGKKPRAEPETIVNSSRATKIVHNDLSHSKA